MENVKVYNDKGGFSGKAPGLFAKAFMEHFPTLSCEDEGRLNDPDLRENFIERVFTLWRFRQAVRASPTLATVRKHTNILQHMLGYLRDLVDDADRKELADIIEDYHRELVPLIVPVTMLKHYVEKHGIEYLKDQYSLNPHPIELKLRNHA
jgi:uncharacterized protein YbgA (DUF1722 family)